MNYSTATDGTRVLKEFAVVCPGVDYVSLLVKAPKKLTKYTGPNSHGISWTTGSVTLGELRSLMMGLFRWKEAIRVRGTQNVLLVKQLLDVKVEELIELSSKSEKSRRCHLHSGGNTVRASCSLENVSRSMML